MKWFRIVFLLTAFIPGLSNLQAEGLYLIKTNNYEHQIQLASNPALTIHLYKDNWVIASATHPPKAQSVLLDATAWSENEAYYLMYVQSSDKESFLAERPFAKLLYEASGMLIVSIPATQVGLTFPTKQDGMVHIPQREAKPIIQKLQFEVNRSEPDPFVQGLLDQVSATNITSSVQHLQNYGTRNAYHAQSVVAQNWIRDQFVNLGLTVELQDFNMPSGSASDNVIATLTGTKYPNEYIVVGAHYDSYTGGPVAPGADDNASGTAGVLEIARILASHTFDRSIIFCAFSGEEYGLYGSEAYAERAALLGMDIHGYFNLDMIGYLKPGNTTIKSSLIYPAGAQELADFYLEVADTYLPDFEVSPGYLSGGDSDHTSFNNNGFMGIFPFEAVPDYSPYIHTTNDIVGPSYNNENQAAIFTKAALASVVTLANRLTPPRGLTAMAGDGIVELQWNPMPDAASFNVYRNGELYQNVESAGFSDIDVENGTAYTYYITAIYSDSNLESDPSNEVTATPLPPLALPFVTDFENGAPYFEFSGGWGISTTQAHTPTHSITESPGGQYQNDVTSFAYLRPFSLNNGFTAAEVSFWTRFDLESNYDYTWFEISTNGTNWITLGQFNGTQNNWQKKTYNLAAYLGEPYVQFRFRFESDGSVTKDGLYVDDFEIITEGGLLSQTTTLNEGWNTLSSVIMPINTTLEELFAPLGNQLIAVQTMDGVYLPQESINTIGDWTPGTGYKVKMAQASGFSISGADYTNASVNLHPGWNLMPVLSTCDVSVEQLFQGQTDNLIMLKEMGTAQVYWPAFQVNTLPTLEPSKAYMVKAANPMNIVFPACKSQAKARKNQVISSPHTHLVMLSEAALTIAQPSDLILAFDSQDLLVGQYEAGSGTPAVVALTGDDSLSIEKEGLAMGEVIRWKLLVASTGSYFDLEASYNTQMPDQQYYEHEGISMIDGFETDVVGIPAFSDNFRIQPNPATTHLDIITGFSGRFQAVIKDMTGKMVRMIEGDQHARVDLSDFKTGVYFIQFFQSEGTSTRVFVKK